MIEHHVIQIFKEPAFSEPLPVLTAEGVRAAITPSYIYSRAAGSPGQTTVDV